MDLRLSRKLETVVLDAGRYKAVAPVEGGLQAPAVGTMGFEAVTQTQGGLEAVMMDLRLLP